MQAAIAGNHIGMVIDQRLAEARTHHFLAERHADGGRYAPCPNGPVVVSMPQPMAVLRMTGGLRSQLPEIP
jgi:hypothetical protein